MSLESRKAKLIAESTEEFRNEEAKISGEYGGDPIAKLKARELDLKAMNDEAERKESEERINLDRSKQMMGQQQFEEKLQQNEDLAELRADTSLEKTQMGIDAKIENDMFKQRDVRILKGPKKIVYNNSIGEKYETKRHFLQRTIQNMLVLLYQIRQEQMALIHLKLTLMDLQKK